MMARGTDRDRYIFPNVICLMLEVTNSSKLIGLQGHMTADVQKHPQLICHHFCLSV
jgi:hypothetical protein